MMSTPHRHYSKDLKKCILHQSTVLGMSPTEILISLDMPLCVVQQALQTWDKIGAVVREPKKLGQAHLMMTDQVAVSLTFFQGV